ncbi:MAG: reverse transcriptase family protein [Pseudomonadota bacterium]
MLLAGPWTEDGRAARLLAWFGPRAPRLRKALLAEVSLAFATGPPPSPPALADWLRDDATALRLHRLLLRRGPVPPAPLEPPVMAPSPPFAKLALPPIATPGALAAWLGVGTDELDWFADVNDRLQRPAKIGRRHYRSRWVAKRSGGARLIEAPLPRLKALQRQVLDGILNEVPAHAAAFGFVPGRSCLAGAAHHAGEEMVVTADLAGFFESVPASRVHAIWRELGYPWAVARILTGLCTLRTPPDVLAERSDLPWTRRRMLAAAHLPQGAPTSPALANLAAYRLDQRLSALLHRAGGRYSRYADDLAFSGDRAVFAGARRFLAVLDEIVCDEGFCLNPAKTRIMPQGARQTVTGLVVNSHANTPRTEFDRLKAILTNCRRHGPAEQNRAGHPAFRQHLEGRVAWVEAVNPRRGARLRALFDAIAWPAPPV